MMSLAVVEKTPADVLDYDVDFTRWLTDSDFIIAAEAEIDDATVTFVVDHVEFSPQVAKVWIAGGADDEQAGVDVTVTTGAGRVKKACFTVRIKDC